MSKSKIFSTAWTMFKNGIFSTFAAALKAAWTKLKLSVALHARIVEIEFVKKATGEVTKRYATLAAELLPNHNMTGEKKIKPVNQITFYDVENEGFRSCLLENIVSINF